MRQKKYRTLIIEKRTVTCPIFDTDFKEVCKQLKSISSKLQKLLPDPSIGPEERIERLARVIPDSVQVSNHHKTARSKLNYISQRLKKLVPDEKCKTKKLEEKVDILVNKLHVLVPGKEKRIFVKLEKMGDNRISDIGR